MSRSLVTSFVTASASVTSALLPSTAAGTSSASTGGNDDGPGAGTVVGIVAGALVGVVVLSGIVGYFFRTKCNKKEDTDYDENPFGNMDAAYGAAGAAATRSEMRRDSQLLADDDSVHQMSELGHGNNPNMNTYGSGNGGSAYGGNAGNYAMAGAGAAAAAGAAGAYGLNRGNSTAHGTPPPGLSRNDTVTPRPPTMIQRHYANMAQHNSNPMPSFQPGQVIQPGQFFPTGQMNQSGPYPSFPPGAAPAVGGAAAAAGYAQGHQRGYSHEQQQQQQEQYSDMPQRSGTPEHSNVQQTYFHQAHDSYSSQNTGPAAGVRTSGGGLHNPFESSNSLQQREGVMDPNVRARRTLSVRNGGMDDVEVRNSVYGGM